MTVKKVSVAIPVWNEEATIARLLDAVFAVDFGGRELEVIVVNDASNDQTKDRISDFRRQRPEIKVITHEQNQGKGAAVRTAIAAATGDAFIVQDADLEYDPREIPSLLETLERDPQPAAVYGSRNLKPRRSGYTLYRRGAGALTRVFNVLYGASLTDLFTCYKLVRMDVLRAIPLTGNGFDFEPEVTAQLLRRGYAIREVPIDYHPRTFAEGKKLHLKHGFACLWAIVKNRF